MTEPADSGEPDYMAMIERVRASKSVMTRADYAATYRAKVFNDAMDMQNAIEALVYTDSDKIMQKVADEAQNIVTNYQMYLHHAKAEAGDD